MILIISDRTDVHAYFVMGELDRIGAHYELLNVTDFPLTATITQSLGPGMHACEFSLDGGSRACSDDVGAVWYRKPELPRLHPALARHEREFVYREIQAGLGGLYDALSQAYWISPLARIRAAANKLAQLRSATRLGFSVPRTVFTNDPSGVRAFVASARNRVVFKSIGESLLATRDGPWSAQAVVAEVFTTLVDEETIESGLSRLSACPVLLQEYVEKDYELRITVVGDDVFAAEIHSQDGSEGEIDWRRGDVWRMDHRIHALPAAEQARCVALVRAFGLQFGAIDVIKSVDGRYVFLEINPNGQFRWVEELTGLEISRALAVKLADADRTTRTRHPRQRVAPASS
jgi:glutathione synthase/RimK-type ligase-like ATP-grasp enzyme